MMSCHLRTKAFNIRDTIFGMLRHRFGIERVTPYAYPPLSGMANRQGFQKTYRVCFRKPSERSEKMHFPLSKTTNGRVAPDLE